MDPFLIRLWIGLIIVAIILNLILLCDKFIPMTCSPPVRRFWDNVLVVVFGLLLFAMVYGIGSLVMLMV